MQFLLNYNVRSPDSSVFVALSRGRGDGNSRKGFQANRELVVRTCYQVQVRGNKEIVKQKNQVSSLGKHQRSIDCH